MDSNKLNQNDDLGNCRVKFAVNLETLSEKISSEMKNGWDSVKKLEKEFDFFVPEIYRPPNNSTILETNPQLSAVRDDLEDWISDSYGTFVTQKYGDKLANQAVSCVPRLFPRYPVASTEFQVLCYFFIMGVILDDYSTDRGDEEGANKKQYSEMGSNTVAELFEATAGNDVIGHRLHGYDVLHQNVRRNRVTPNNIGTPRIHQMARYWGKAGRDLE
ncbi:hypothetical protein Fcan01_15763 [Folsomia candida]|uniref:Uncharacterized protein n=1 Tax=Folsomia candida TaxID=158441 RepID=A0A226DV92_FOLCA|nr:hypothetical protein Fcan01_15763 [Folsomia candida]